MRWMLTLVIGLVIGPSVAAAERAASPADATVFIRLVGSVRAEIEDIGTGKQTIDLERIEIGTGSGFVISPHGYVLTNEHVIRNNVFTITDGLRKGKFALKVARIDVCLPAAASAAPGDRSRCFEASVHSSDAALDLAVLFVSASDLPYVALGDSDAIRNGQAIQALGYPFGRELAVGRIAAPDIVPEVSTSPGTISALRAGDAGERRALQINGTVNPGNSGGPLVDRDGYAVGVIRARVTGDAGIGFAIPINQAKDFFESHGLDSLMPVRRFRLGPLQRFEEKGIALPLPEGIADTSPFRARVESDPASDGVALRIDRGVSPWAARQIERTLVGTSAFEQMSVEANESQPVSRPKAASLLLGRATGKTADDPNGGMYYAILDLGGEQLVARYVGSAEELAYNESVFRGSLLNLEGRRLMSSELISPDRLEWAVAASGQSTVPLPAGWIVEPGAPSRCGGLPQASAIAAAYPPGDVTLALRVATWDTAAVSPQAAAAAAACASQRGSQGAASYALRIEWLGVSYSIEGAFVRLDSGQVAQLEVISPVQKGPVARALLEAWIRKSTGP
jgi:S1-C subfamily serine protease